MNELSLQKMIFKLGWGAMTAASIFLFAITSLYFSFRSDFNFLLVKQDVVFNVFWRTAFYVHITGGMVALIIAPFQFLKPLRRNRMTLHRNLGKAYIGSILFVAGPSGLFMAFYAEGSWFSKMGFLIMSLLWIWTTFRAYETVRNRDIAGHIRWITRSVALTMAAVTLRFYVPIASAGLHWDHAFVVESSAWVSWIPNLLVAEILIRWFPLRL